MRQVKVVIGLLSLLFVFSYFLPTTAEAAKTEAEPNNTIAKATKIGQLDEVEGALTNVHDVDMYRVDLSAKGKYTLHTILGDEFERNKQYANSYKVTLYNANGKIIKTSTTSQSNYLDDKFYYHTMEASLDKATYYIKIHVTNQNSNIVSEPYLLLQEFNNGSVSITSLKPSIPSPQPTNKTIKWTTTAKGSDLQYQYSVYSNKKWATVQKYSTNNTFNWLPKNAGTYKVRVHVRNTVSGKTVSKESNYTVFKPSNFSITSFKANKTSPQTRGTKITYSVQAKGNHLEYRFRVYENGKWRTAKNYSSSKSYDAQPYYRGVYKVAVDVRQKGTSKVQTKTITMSIKEPPAYRIYLSYYLSNNSGELTVHNNGKYALTVNKIQLYNGTKAIYSSSPKNWSVKGNGSKTFTFSPKNKLTQFNSSTYAKISYTYDGMKHIAELKR